MTWYNNSWNYRKAITVSNSGSALTDYQTLVIIDTASLITATKMRSDCGDIRLTDSDDSTILYYWIESGINSSSTRIWVKIPSISAGAKTVYLYYGNSSATSLSNGTNTFIFFDDFSGNLSKWTITGSTQIISGEAAISGNTYNANGMTSVASIYRPAIIEWKSRVSALANIETWEGYSTQPLNYGSGLSFSRGWAGSLTRYLDGAYTSAGTWTITQTLQKIILKPTQGYTVFWNDVQKEDSSTWGTDGNKIAFQQRSTSYYLYIDDVRVRKYAYPEPTTCVGGEEVSTVSWLTNWNRRKLMTITGSTSSSQTDYQMKLIVHKSTGTDTYTDIYLGTNVNNDFSDLRFTKNDGSTNLNYWIESYTSGSVTTVWIKIPSIPISPCTTTIYLYYGNSSVTTTSDGNNTFLFFDDFIGTNGTIPNTAKWTRNVTGSGAADIQNNTLRTYIPSSSNGFVNSINNISPPCIIELSAKASSLWGSNDPWFGLNDIGVLFGTSSGIFWIGSYGSTWTTWSGYSLDTWYKFRFKYTSTTFTVEEDVRANTYTRTITIPATLFKFGDNQPHVNGKTMYMDDFRVRKYASPEPTFSSTGTEELSTGDLNISSTPDGAVGASVYIDNSQTASGVTPLIVTGFTPGDHTYKLTKTGYTDTSVINFTITAGQTTTISQNMLTVANITATNMTITPSETPCRQGICTVTIVVRWSNSGETNGTVIPNIKIDTVSQTAHTSRTVLAGSHIDETFVISGMTTGTHTICPDPN